MIQTSQFVRIPSPNQDRRQSCQGHITSAQRHSYRRKPTTELDGEALGEVPTSGVTARSIYAPSSARPNAQSRHLDVRLFLLHASLALVQADATKGEPEGSEGSLLLIPKVEAVSEGVMR